VFGQAGFGIESGDIASWAVGSHLSGGTVSAHLGYSHFFKSSADTNIWDLFFVSVSLQF
jgi:hemolysin activation/secretion protein